jgi:hypothetical protein
MKDHARELIAATAQALAGRAHTLEEMHATLYQLALDIVSPARAALPTGIRRAPLANEVLPRHQRATWARGQTAYDVDEG